MKTGNHSLYVKFFGHKFTEDKLYIKFGGRVKHKKDYSQHLRTKLKNELKKLLNN